MQCPDCPGVRTSVPHTSAIIDQCGLRKGIWFDAGEVAAYIRRKAGPLAKPPGDPDFDVALSIPAGKCPKCRTDTLFLGFFNGLSFSRCESCGGLYLSHEQVKSAVRDSSVFGDRESNVNVAAEVGGNIALSATLSILEGLFSP